MIDRTTGMEQRALHVEVHREDGSYWAEVRELPGCFASGATPAQLIGSAEEAVALYLAPSNGPTPRLAIRLAGFDLSLESEQPLRAV
jgi:predicted RNase H-like HicB family nuclease